MLAFIVLLFAAFSRLLPHLAHAQAWNFTALGGSLLFFGSRLRQTAASSPARAGLQLAGGIAILAAMDVYLTTQVYQFPFHVSGYLVTWVWYVAAALLGMEILSRVSALRVGAAVLASATSFFILSNFVVWAGSAMYPRTLSGLATCYTLAIPFYRNDLVSTALTATVLFGLPALATSLQTHRQTA